MKDKIETAILFVGHHSIPVQRYIEGISNILDHLEGTT